MRQLPIHAMLALTAFYCGCFLPTTHASTDVSAPLLTVEKVFAGPEPLGKIHVSKLAQGEDANSPALRVRCNLFEATVPAVALADIPRAEWGAFDVAYSANDGAVSDKPTERLRFYIQVSISGPIEDSWRETWVTFHFDGNGNLTRKIKAFRRSPSGDSIDVIWNEWPIGAGVTAEDALTHRKGKGAAVH